MTQARPINVLEKIDMDARRLSRFLLGTVNAKSDEILSFPNYLYNQIKRLCLEIKPKQNKIKE